MIGGDGINDESNKTAPAKRPPRFDEIQSVADLGKETKDYKALLGADATTAAPKVDAKSVKDTKTHENLAKAVKSRDADAIAKAEREAAKQAADQQAAQRSTRRPIRPAPARATRMPGLPAVRGYTASASGLAVALIVMPMPLAGSRRRLPLSADS